MSAVNQLRIAAVEPYFGGSHRHFFEDLQRHSRHSVELFTLPPRLWKWRVRGSALHLARQLNATTREGVSFDLLLCSDFVNVPDLRALLDTELRSVPVVYYLHENQMTYPLSPDEEFDPYFGFTNVLSALSAEAVAFNSEFHRRQFLARLPGFLPRLPDYEPHWVVETIGAKAEVLPIGLDIVALEELRPAGGQKAGGLGATPGSGAAPASDVLSTSVSVPRVLWNHRWEFDKRPELFFTALERLAGEGVTFTVDVVGESFARQPAVFDSARERLGNRLDHFGYVASREEYIRLLWDADFVVSTAQQEFFGIAVAEAVLCGAHPVLPRSLVYEELYGAACSRHHLYRDDEDLVALLRRLLAGPFPDHECHLPERLRTFDWRRVAPRFDARFEVLASARR